MPPGIDAGKGRLQDVFTSDDISPGFGHYLRGHQRLTDFALESVHGGDDVGVVLVLHLGLAPAMPLSVVE